MTRLWISAGIELQEGAHLDKTLEALRILEEKTATEPGCFKFEVLHDIEHPTKFVLWECWTDEAALAEHYAAPHTVHYLSFGYTKVNYISRLTPNSQKD